MKTACLPSGLGALSPAPWVTKSGGVTPGERGSFSSGDASTYDIPPQIYRRESSLALAPAWSLNKPVELLVEACNPQEHHNHTSTNTLFVT